MSCAAHRANRGRFRGRVLCFECYRTKLDRPERLHLAVTAFPRVLTMREMEHRRRMLEHLQETNASASSLAPA